MGVETGLRPVQAERSSAGFRWREQESR